MTIRGNDESLPDNPRLRSNLGPFLIEIPENVLSFQIIFVSLHLNTG